MKRALRWCSGLLLAAGACISRSPTVIKPDEMSAAEHRRQAAREQSMAREYDRTLEHDPLVWQQPLEAPAGFVFPISPLNREMAERVAEDDRNIKQANALRDEARQHKRAARTLEKFEKAECGGTPASARAACPVLGPLAQLDDIPGGVRATFSDPARVDGVVAQMRCHFAYEQTRGFDEATACPMYLPGIDIRQAVDNPAAVDVTSADPRVADELREQAREQAVFATAQAPRSSAQSLR
jgi:hypothetical protein